jgi:hypothetical protein
MLLEGVHCIWICFPIGHVVEQAVQVVAPVTLVKLILSVQELQADAPRKLEYIPIRQAVQTVAPLLGL